MFYTRFSLRTLRQSLTNFIVFLRTVNLALRVLLLSKTIAGIPMHFGRKGFVYSPSLRHFHKSRYRVHFLNGHFIQKL